MKQKLTGELLMKKAVNQILQRPETWNQCEWHSSCGTKHCLAGWCQILSGKEPNPDTAKIDAKTALGISDNEASWLFRGTCSISEMHYFATNFNRDGFDHYGFDHYGFDRDGFDRYGFNHYGFGRDGFDRYGFDRYGLDRYGFDRDGLDRYGFDRDGFDRYGFDRYGFNRDGSKLPLFIL